VFDSNCETGEHCEAGSCVPFSVCTTSLDCVGAGNDRTICDPSIGECVECGAVTDCPEDNDCIGHVCVPYTACNSSLDCQGAPQGPICDSATQRCVQCVLNADCDAEGVCARGHCSPPCTSDNHCTPLGLLCNVAGGYCVRCTENLHCPELSHCSQEVCQLDVCQAGQPACQGTARATCNADGSGFGTVEPCPTGQRCVATAGSASCEGSAGADGADDGGDDGGTRDNGEAGGSGGSPSCGAFSESICTALEGALIHRYSFDGSGSAVTDSRGGSHGTASASVSGGMLNLSGTGESHVNLPNGLVSVLTNATFEFWFQWNGTARWQRIFDFGTNTSGEDLQGTEGTTYLMLTPMTADNDIPGGPLRLVYSISGPLSETRAEAATPLATGVMSHLVAVVDDSNNALSLYLNGALASSTAFDGALSLLTDVNNWLGRSQFSADTETTGIYDEFRIYNAALNAAQIQASFMLGPNPAFLSD